MRPVLLAQNIREVKEMAYSFRGGIHPGTHADPGYKSATNTKPIEKLALPDEVILPVSMHIGAPAKRSFRLATPWTWDSLSRKPVALSALLSMLPFPAR